MSKYRDGWDADYELGVCAPARMALKPEFRHEHHDQTSVAEVVIFDVGQCGVTKEQAIMLAMALFDAAEVEYQIKS
jgi:hypothetical protein